MKQEFETMKKKFESKKKREKKKENWKVRERKFQNRTTLRKLKNKEGNSKRKVLKILLFLDITNLSVALD